MGVRASFGRWASKYKIYCLSTANPGTKVCIGLYFIILCCALLCSSHFPTFAPRFLKSTSPLTHEPQKRYPAIDIACLLFPFLCEPASTTVQYSYVGTCYLTFCWVAGRAFHTFCLSSSLQLLELTTATESKPSTNKQLKRRLFLPHSFFLVSSF
ncbi:hypothetical protein F4818DRAFT_287555 [Hypoxylon cercidicola]|nr:hypothetical protein F4818DRAFT_287555 [Hypoxylon cercidicola]